MVTQGHTVHKSLSPTDRFVDLTLPGCFFPPVARLSLLVSNLFSKDKHKKRNVKKKTCTDTHTHTTWPIKKASHVCNVGEASTVQIIHNACQLIITHKARRVFNFLGKVTTHLYCEMKAPLARKNVKKTNKVLINN